MQDYQISQTSSIHNEEKKSVNKTTTSTDQVLKDSRQQSQKTNAMIFLHGRIWKKQIERSLAQTMSFSFHLVYILKGSQKGIFLLKNLPITLSSKILMASSDLMHLGVLYWLTEDP